MPDQTPPDVVESISMLPVVETLALHVEDISLSKRKRKTLVRATLTTATHEKLIEEKLAHEHVVVERIAIGRRVDSPPAIRQEGDVTIISVVEEVLVTETRLMLKEEVHLRRVKTQHIHAETVLLRQQGVTVTRTDIDG